MVNKTLKEAGIRLPLELVVTICQRLRNGDSAYSIHSPKEGYPLAAKNTVVKIRQMLEEGKLDFLTGFSAVDKAIETALGSPEGTHPYRSKVSRKTRVERRAQEVLFQLPLPPASLLNMQIEGIPDVIALRILENIDLTQQEVDLGGWTISRLVQMIKFRTLCEWYKTEVPDPGDKNIPHDILEKAAANYAIGLVDGNQRLMRASHDVCRYQIWRSLRNLKTYRRVHHIPDDDSRFPRPLETDEFNGLMYLVAEWHLDITKIENNEDFNVERPPLTQKTKD